MRDVLYLAWRYLLHHKLKAGLLIAAVTVIVSLPVGLHVVVDRSAAHLVARAAATPLLVGAKGSPLELVLNTLYFEYDAPPRMRYAEVTRVAESGLATAIPVYTAFRAQDSPIVGTTPEYFTFRGLQADEGRFFGVLGECVLGSEAARSAGVGVGGHVMSSPESVFDLAGVYPLKMRVVGVLPPTGTADDLAAFVDVKTAWIIEGLGHGHQDLNRPGAATSILRREGDMIVANASVREFNEITEDNIDSFHFHGDLAEYPVTAVIAVPRDDKAAALLRGRYLGADERVQIVRPAVVLQDLLATVFTVRRYVMAAVVGVGAATLAMMVLVFVLSVQLRRREMETMVKIGGARGRVVAIIVCEVVCVLGAGGVLAGLLSAAMWRYGDALIRAFLMSS